MRRLVDKESRFRSLRDDGLIFGAPLHWFDEVGSTNDELKTLARKGAPEGSLVVADSQNSGRGRRGRRWFSPPGSGLWFSVLLRPKIHLDGLDAVARLNRLGAEAVTRALREGFSVDAKVKEPNDVLVKGKKICGILCESSLVAGTKHAEWLVVGCGLNLHTNLPPELEDSATRLVDWLNPCPDPQEILLRICKEFDGFAALGET